MFLIFECDFDVIYSNTKNKKNIIIFDDLIFNSFNKDKH